MQEKWAAMVRTNSSGAFGNGSATQRIPQRAHSALSSVVFLLLPHAVAADAVSVYQTAMPSVVVVEAKNRKQRTARQGSGVVIDASTVVTNCHVIESSEEILVGQPPTMVVAERGHGSLEKDLCFLHADVSGLKAATFGSTASLQVGSPVYALGAPRGMSFTLSDGIVSQLRGEAPSLVQTTAAISPGSSGGGLFDGDGALIGITTFNVEGGQSLNFALPVEWIHDVAADRSALVAATSISYRARFVDAFRAGKRTNAIEIAKSWIVAFPADAEGYYRLGLGLAASEALNEAIEAFNEGLKIAPSYAPLWFQLGNVYGLLEKGASPTAVAAYKEATRLDPGAAEYWLSLGAAEVQVRELDDGTISLKRALELDPELAAAWHLLGQALHLVRLEAFRSNGFRRSAEVDAIQDSSLGAFRTAHELEPSNTRFGLDLGYALSGAGECDKARDIAAKLKAQDPVSGLEFEAHISRRYGPCL